MHMSLRAVLFTSAIVGWVFATLGVLYHDVTARDVGLLVTVAALGLAVLAGDATLGIEIPRRRREPRARRTADAPERAPAPAPAPKPAAASEARPIAAPVDTRAAWGAPTTAWDADAGVASASPVAVQEPVTVAPVTNGNGHGQAFADVAVGAPPQPDSQGPTQTRGLCGKCRTPITVSTRRPLRVTCPVCGHSKVLT